MDKNKNILMEKNERIDNAINTIMLELIKLNKITCGRFEITRSISPRVSNLELRDFLKNKLVNTCTECGVSSRSRINLRGNPLTKDNFIFALDELFERCHADSEIKVKDIAECLAMSERQLYRKVKLLLGLTPSEYLKLFRLRKAKVLLSRGKGVNSVAYEVGFSSHAYFSRCFKSHFGKLPSEYKRFWANAN